MDFNGFQCRLCVEMVFETRLEGKKATDHGEEDHAAAPEVAHLRHVASQLKKIRKRSEIHSKSREFHENLMRIS